MGLYAKSFKIVDMPELWVHLIMQCITTVSYSFFVNGEPTGRKRPKVGLRIGDPVSPNLFILCMESMSRNFSVQQERGVIKGLKWLDKLQRCPTSCLLVMPFF